MFMDEFNNGGAPAINADRLNEPFYIKTLTYDAGNNRLALTIGRGRAELFSGSNRVIIEKNAETVYYINAPAINTTYYIYLGGDGNFTHNTTGFIPSGAVLLWHVATGATVSTLTKTDRRYQIGGCGAKLGEHLPDTAPHSATSAATASRLMLRDVAGRSKVAAPSASDDIARKDTVDNHGTANQTHGASGSYYLAKTTRSDQLPTWGDIQSKPSTFTPSSHGSEAHNNKVYGNATYTDSIPASGSLTKTIPLGASTYKHGRVVFKNVTVSSLGGGMAFIGTDNTKTLVMGPCYLSTSNYNGSAWSRRWLGQVTDFVFGYTSIGAKELQIKEIYINGSNLQIEFYNYAASELSLNCQVDWEVE